MKKLFAAFSILASLMLASGGTFADEMFGKFRLTASINSQSTAGGVQSNADNSADYTKRAPDGQVIDVLVIDDPRPDQAATNRLSIKDSLAYNLGVSFGLLKWKWGEMTLDSSVGYFSGKLESLEMAGEFATATGGVDPPRVACGEVTRYHLFYYSIGSVEQLPVSVGATFHFRTRAKGGPIRAMSPYVGAGIGYMFVQIDPSDEFLQLSENLMNSTGSYQYATGGGRSATTKPHQFGPVVAEAPNSFLYYVRGGLDFPMGKGWSIFINGGYMWANEAIRVTADGKESFGTATPNGEININYPERGTPAVLLTGGLVDYASGTPTPIPGRTCKFTIGPRDGVLDTGNYYIQGGTIRYDGITIGLGGRYQF